jgi:putative tryptophan/tyrosine transport system substrate-binding protein
MRFHQLKRREFITLLGGAAAVWPLVARAQQGRLRRVGVVVGLAADDPETKSRIGAFLQGMEKQGWSEGRNLQIDYRWAGTDDERIRSYAAELVGAMPDVLLATNTPVVAALQQATRSIPVVFVTIGDPVGQGFVASLARPGGNTTGFTGFEFALGGKWVGFLKELAPSVTRMTYLYHPEIGPFYSLLLKSVEAACATLSVETAAAAVRAPADIERVISIVAAQPNGALIVQPDGYTVANRRLIIELAARHRVPTFYAHRVEAAEGGLASYGADYVDLYRRAAGYVDRILRGEKPADLPVQQPTKYELVINLKTAKALSLTIPEPFIQTADEVIE